mgnify:CR=1 FL=1
MIERMLTRSSAVREEPSIAAVTLRLIGLSGFLMLACIFAFAFMKPREGTVPTHTWAIPLAIWVGGTAWLYSGAVRAVLNAPARDTSTWLFRLFQGITVGYFGILLLARDTGDWEFVKAFAMAIEFVVVTGVFIFVSIGLITRTPLSREIWISLVLGLCAVYPVIKGIIEMIGWMIPGST